MNTDTNAHEANCQAESRTMKVKQTGAGYYTGDGRDNRKIAGVGFKPNRVEVDSDIERAKVICTSNIWGGIDSRNWWDVPLTNAIKSLDADGFTVGTSDSVNKDGVGYEYQVTGERQVFEPNRDWLREKLSRKNQPATPKEKGDFLEEIAKQLLSWTYGLEVKGPVRTATGEWDLYVRNMSGLPYLNWLGELSVVEAKNWEARVDAQALKVFRGTLEDAKVKTGILFTRNGITGPDRKNAAGAIINAFQQDETIIVVFDFDDLGDIAEGKDFVRMLMCKRDNVRRGRI